MARNRLWREVTAEADIQRFYDEKVVTRPATSLHRKIAKGALVPGSIHVGPPGSIPGEGAGGHSRGRPGGGGADDV